MKKFLSVILATVLALTLALGVFAADPATATAKVYVIYSTPGLTGVTFELKNAENTTVATSEATAEDTAIIAIEYADLTDAATGDYTVVAVKDGVVFNKTATTTITVALEGDAYKATATNAVLYTGYTRDIINEEFENLTQVTDPKVDWKQATKADDGIFVGNNGVSVIPAELADATVVKTTGSKWGDQDGIRTPSFAAKADRVYTATAKLMAIENDVFTSIWNNDNDGNCLRITEIYENKVNYLLAFKDWDKNEWSDDYDYQWNPSSYSYDWDQNNAMPDGYYWKDKQGDIPNLAGNGQWGHDGQTADVWTTLHVSMIPKADLDNVVFDVSAFSKYFENASYEYDGATYDKVWFAPHIYIDSIVITETVADPVVPDPLPEVPSDEPEVENVITMAGKQYTEEDVLDIAGEKELPGEWTWTNICSYDTTPAIGTVMAAAEGEGVYLKLDGYSAKILIQGDHDIVPAMETATAVVGGAGYYDIHDLMQAYVDAFNEWAEANGADPITSVNNAWNLVIQNASSETITLKSAKLVKLTPYTPPVEEPETDFKRTGWFCTGEKYHAMIIGRAIISLPHEFNDNGDCLWCRYHIDIIEEDVEIEPAFESETEETEDDVVVDDNPTTGVALTLIPAVICGLALITSKKR